MSKEEILTILQVLKSKIEAVNQVKDNSSDEAREFHNQIINSMARFKMFIARKHE